jgi:hypothetical protein
MVDIPEIKYHNIEDPLGLIQRLNKPGGNRYIPYDNIFFSYLPSEGGFMYNGTEDSWTMLLLLRMIETTNEKD